MYRKYLENNCTERITSETYDSLYEKDKCYIEQRYSFFNGTFNTDESSMPFVPTPSPPTPTPFPPGPPKYIQTIFYLEDNCQGIYLFFLLLTGWFVNTLIIHYQVVFINMNITS